MAFQERSPSCNHCVYYEMYREWSCTIGASKTRSLSLPGTSRSNESSMAPLDAGQTSGTDNGPLLSGAGLPSDPPLSKKRTWKRAENPPQTASVDDLRSRDFASSLLQVNLFFSFFLSSLPRQQPAPPRAIVREATSKFFANGPLMAGYACVVFSNEPVGVVSSLITRITSTGKPSVRTRETTPFPSTTARPYSSPLCTLELARYRRVLAASLNARQTEERIAIVSSFRRDYLLTSSL